VQICDNLPLGRLTPAEQDHLADCAQALDVTITLGTRGISPGHLETYLELCRRFRSPILRVVVDTMNDEPKEDEIVQRLRSMVPWLQGAGVRLAIENHDRFKATTLARVMEKVNSDFLGICLDTVNSFGALEGPEYVVKTLAPWVVDLHVKDFAIARAEHKMGFTLAGRPAGQGQLDVEWILRILHQHGRDPDAILELWPPPQPTIAETVALELRWCTDSIAYLRTITGE
jgi:sugar phosphate isomerase/epimerase